MAVHQVNYRVVLEALDKQRIERDMSWRAMATDIGIPGGTFSRLRQGKGCADYTFVALMSWLSADESIRPYLHIPEQPE